MITLFSTLWIDGGITTYLSDVWTCRRQKLLIASTNLSLSYLRQSKISRKPSKNQNMFFWKLAYVDAMSERSFTRYYQEQAYFKKEKGATRPHSDLHSSNHACVSTVPMCCVHECS